MLRRSFEEWSSPFQRSCMMDGHAFFVHDENTVQAELRRVSSKNYSLLEADEEPNFEDHYLEPDAKGRLNRARDIFQDNQEKKRKVARIDECPSDLLVDTAQNPEKRPRLSRTGKMMSILTNSLVWSDKYRTI